MELDQFIKNTLLSISKGLRETNLEIAKRDGKTLGVDAAAAYMLESHNRDSKEGYITFDVAVTVSSETKKSGGGGIKIAVASIGGEVSNSGTQEHVSRIKFHVLPWQNIN
jgi:hypothetical protein